MLAGNFICGVYIQVYPQYEHWMEKVGKKLICYLVVGIFVWLLAFHDLVAMIIDPLLDSGPVDLHKLTHGPLQS